MRPLALLTLLPLAACAGPPDLCGADGYEGLVGTPLAAATLPADLGARVIGPDSVVTMDFVEDRLNIRVDGDGVVTGLYCG